MSFWRVGLQGGGIAPLGHAGDAVELIVFRARLAVGCWLSMHVNDGASPTMTLPPIPELGVHGAQLVRAVMGDGNLLCRVHSLQAARQDPHPVGVLWVSCYDATEYDTGACAAVVVGVV